MSLAGTSSSATDLPSGKRTLRLHVWGTNTYLPTLDPISLYAASLLQATFAYDSNVQLQLASASTSLSRVPLLQVLDEQNRTVELVDQVEAIRSFCVTAGLDSNVVSDAELGAKQVALHALVDDQLLDLTLHSLFSFPSNYRSVTAPAYSSIGGIQTSASKSTLSKITSLPLTFQPSIPSRLRNVVETRLTATGLWGLGGKEATAQIDETDQLAARAGIVSSKKKGLAHSAKQAVHDEFERSKLVIRAKQCFEVMNAILSIDDTKFVMGAHKLTSLDAHLYGFLAPLLFAQPKLPVDTLPKLINETYPRLARYLEHVKQQLETFPNLPKWISPAETQLNPPILTNTTSTNPGWLDYLWPFTNSSIKASSTTSTSPLHSSYHHHHQQQQQASSSSSFATPQHPTESVKKSTNPEDRKLRLGRALWICSALIGLVGYTFASGIVSVQFVDSEDLEDLEEAEEDEEEGDQDAEDGWEVQSESELEEELDEMDLDGDPDEEDEY